MASTGDQKPSTGASVLAKMRRRRTRWVATAAALGLLVGLGSGVLISSDTAELEAAKHSLRRSEQRTKQLESGLSAMTAKNGELNGLLDQAHAQAASAAAEADAEERRLDARQARLDKRAKALELRERDLAWYSEAETTVDGGDAETVVNDSEFDRAYAVDIATDIVEDVTTVDQRLGDGIGVTSALSLLSDSYGRMLEAGMPPGTGSKYYSRLATLQTFAGDAANLYEINPLEGRAKYVVIRQQTVVLLGQLNVALNTTFRLPPR